MPSEFRPSEVENAFLVSPELSEFRSSELNNAFLGPEEHNRTAVPQKQAPTPLTVVEGLRVQLEVRKTQPNPHTVPLSPR